MSSQTPDKLNEELRKQITDDLTFAFDGLDTNDEGFKEVVKGVTDEIMGCITAAYAEAGYMTGQAWYGRFEKELGSQVLNDAVRVFDHMIEAAKRASGLLPNGEEKL